MYYHHQVLLQLIQKAHSLMKVATELLIRILIYKFNIHSTVQLCSLILHIIFIHCKGA
jgi:hypothetical protein